MTTQAARPGQAEYKESVRLPMWGIGFLGLMLGVTAGILTGVAIRNLVGDEPVIDGSGAAVFYVAFGLAVLLDLFLLFNFTFLSVSVTNAGFQARYGMFSKSFRFEQVKKIETADYRWLSYGGWGIRYSTGGRRAWSQLGVKQGVVVEVNEGGSDRSYFVSSNRPEELADVLARRIGQAGPGESESTTPAEPS